jgi:hypothetical protein
MQFSIKYEDLEIARGDSRPAGLNSIPGTLRDIIFKGQTANYLVLLKDGSEIVVSGAPRELHLQPGEAVTVHWPASRGATFPV